MQIKQTNEQKETCVPMLDDEEDELDVEDLFKLGDEDGPCPPPT
jgi:hypothetical protein